MNWRMFGIIVTYVLISGISIAACYLYLSFVYSNDPNNLLAQASFIIASIAAVFAGISALIANNSMKLSRNTVRPFINVEDASIGYSGSREKSKTVKYTIFQLENTGTFPADEITFTHNLSINGKKISFRLYSEVPSICFPNAGISNLRFIKPESEDRLEINKGDELELEIEVKYRNKLTRNWHKTGRFYSVSYDPETNPQPIPLSEKDFWD